ncbi:MAG: hypothetical protein KAV87_28100 [Desulfobacteraceae bacterium]|nr:hypothetical protein [Desulfobacteraceae bacterium]
MADVGSGAPLPDDSGIPEKSLDTIQRELFNPADGTREILERSWYRNILYYSGEQWIRWSRGNKGFVPAYGAHKRKQRPTPVSNIIRDYVRSMKALVLNKQYVIRVWPESNKSEDKQAAILGENLLRDIESRDDFAVKEIEEDVALWMLLTGTGFIRDYPSMEKGIPLIGTGVKTGDVATESIMTFNVFPDTGAGVRLSDKRKVGIQCLKHKDWILDNFPGANITSSSQTSYLTNYQITLAKMVANVSPWKSDGIDLSNNVTTNDVGADELALFREIEFAPTKKWPNGRYAVFVGDELLKEYDRLPIPVEDGKWMYTLEDFRHNLMPGRFWGESGINDLVSPQNIINRIDQALIQNRKGIGRPIVMTPGGIKLKKKTRAGSSFLQVQFDPTEAKGFTPTVSHGTPLPRQVLEERAIQKSVSQDSAGNPKNVLQGQSPGSGASGLMVDILRETAEQGHAPDVNRYYRALSRSNRKRLIIAQELYAEKRIIKVGEESDVNVQQFKGADLRKNTDVRIELTSGLSTTNAGKINTVKELVAQGFFNEQVVDLETRNELMEKIGITGFKTKVSKDMARASKENSQMINGVLDFYVEEQLVDPESEGPLMVPQLDEGTGETIQVPMIDPETGEPPWVATVPDPIFALDDHQIHAETHRQFMITQEFDDQPDDAKKIFMKHYEAHVREMVKAIEAQQQAAMQQAQLSNISKGGPPV